MYSITLTSPCNLNPLEKIQVTKRQEIEYVIKGGGIVAKLDAVSFELFHYSCKNFLNNSDDEILRVDIDSAKDGWGNIVQYTYTVYLNDDTNIINIWY